MSENKLRTGITQGDIAGIGWEVILKCFADPRMVEVCTPVIYGSPRAAEFWKEHSGEIEIADFNIIDSAAEARRGKLNLVPCADVEFEPGHPTAATGAAAAEALRKAAADLKSGAIDTLVTAPIDKAAIQSDSFAFTGHTEFLAGEFSGQPVMIMCSDKLRVGLATIHIPVSEVSAAITKEGIVSSLQRLERSLIRDFGVVKPRIAVLALNPHAGDGGLLGHEEKNIIKPAIEEAFTGGTLAFGPFAADGFFASDARTRYDAVLAMYHDQGLAPFKTISPDGVNFTAGLECVRTSPDHGTACDIAGQDKADPQSMRNAIYMASDIFENRRRYDEWSRNPLKHYEREKGRDMSVKDLHIDEKED